MLLQKEGFRAAWPASDLAKVNRLRIDIDVVLQEDIHRHFDDGGIWTVCQNLEALLRSSTGCVRPQSHIESILSPRLDGCDARRKRRRCIRLCQARDVQRS